MRTYGTIRGVFPRMFDVTRVQGNMLNNDQGDETCTRASYS